MDRKEAAAIVRQTATEMNLKPGEAMMAIEIAARAVERGRHFTATEKLKNLRKACEEDGGEDAKWIADFISNKCGVPPSGDPS